MNYILRQDLLNIQKCFVCVHMMVFLQAETSQIAKTAPELHTNKDLLQGDSGSDTCTEV